MSRPLSLPTARVREPDPQFGTVLFETGAPVRFTFLRNTEPSPHFGARYGQDVEPTGRYILHKTEGSTPPRGWTTGVVELRRPLVMPLTTGADIYGPDGWKAHLVRATGKRGRALSRALLARGYDGVVTVTSGETREIVCLSAAVAPKKARRDPRRSTRRTPMRSLRRDPGPDYEAKRAARIERMRARAAGLRAEGQSRHAAGWKILDRIPLGQPILVGHHSERRHRRDLQRSHRNMEKSWEATQRAQDLERRASAAETSTAVSSDDPRAVEKLEAKLAGLVRDQERMKLANALLRKKATDEQIAAALGWTVAQAQKLKVADPFGRVGFPAFAVSNNSAEIRRVKARIAELRARAAAPPRPAQAFGAVRVEESDNRVRLYFPGKPDAAVRAEMKSHGFRWSPTEGAWQRQATADARYWATQLAAKFGTRTDPRRARKLMRGYRR
jgi:hypothetical protein